MTRATLLPVLLVACTQPPVGPEGTVVIPAGRYPLGEGPSAREIELAAFHIDRLPVTEAQLRRFAASEASAEVLSRRDAIAARERGDDLPANDISWDEADAYCRHAQGGRLPTSDEWEAAARGTDKRAYPWGEQRTLAHMELQTTGGSPVGAHPDGASPFGVEDMAGNIFHWSATAVRNPGQTEPEWQADELRVVRGGGWPRLLRYSTTTYRTALDPAWRSPFVGFRCAYPLEPGSDPNPAAEGPPQEFATPLYDTSQTTRQLLSSVLDPERWLPALFQTQIEALPPDAQVADVGAGLGFLSFRLSRKLGTGGKVYAVDIDSEVLRFVRAYAEQRNMGNIEIVEAGSEQTGLKPESLDALFMQGTLHHPPPEETAGFLAGYVETLKPGGLLVIEDSLVHEETRSVMDDPANHGLELIAYDPLELSWLSGPAADDPPAREDPQDFAAVLRKIP